MKTLKKTLCLVLAVVMVVGVLIIPANAAYDDFTDVETVKHPVAAEVLTALGIFTGYSDTTFGPNETLTRAQGATIIARAMLTPAQAATLPAVNSFKDVTAAFGWAAGPINFCMQQGIVSGHGNGIFDPNGELTGYQLAKMLLVIMGVGEGSDYTGNGYEMKVHLDAVDCGLFKDISGVDYSKPITRENAAQMLFNAITTDPSGETSYTYLVWLDTTANNIQDAGETVLYNGADQFMALAAMMNRTEARMKTNRVTVNSIGARVFGLGSSSITDEFQRTISTWVADYNTASTADDVTVELGLPDSVPYVSGVTAEKIAIDMGITNVTTSYTLHVWEDGVADTTNSHAYDRTSAHNTPVTFGGIGSRVEVVPVSATEFNVYVINTYVQKLTAANIVPAAAATPTDNGHARYITLSAHGASVNYETNDFAENDVLIYNLGQKNGSAVALNVVKPNYITGTVTRVTTDGTMTIGGQTYKWAEHANTTAKSTYGVITGSAAVFYLDSYNNVIFADNTSGPAAVENYLYIVDFAAVAGGSTGGDGLFVPGTTTSAVAQAKVIDLKTGNLLLVNVAISYNAVDGRFYYVNANGTRGAEVTDLVAGRSGISGLKPFKVLDDGTYAISKDDTVADYAGTLTITRGNPTLTAGSLYATSATKTTVVTLNKDANGVIVSGTVNEYTGYNDFPVAGINTANAVATVVKSNADNVATSIIIVLDPAIKAESYKYALYVGSAGSALVNGVRVDLYQWIVDGESVYLTHTYTGAAPTANHVYTINAVDGNIDAVPVEALPILSSTLVSSTDAGYFIAGGQLYNLAAESVILKNTTWAVLGGLEKNQTVTAYGEGNTVYLVVVA